MKRLIFIFIMLFSIPIFAQDGGEGFGDYFADFGQTVLLIGAIVEAVKQWGKITGVALQIISWLMGIIVVMAAHFLELGIYAEHSAIKSLAIGVALSLVTNGVSNLGMMQWLLGVILPKLKSSKEIKEQKDDHVGGGGGKDDGDN